MESQKIIRKLLKDTSVDPIEFISKRNWSMTRLEIENVLTHVLGRMPSDKEINMCKPSKVQKVLRQRAYFQNKWGK